MDFFDLITFLFDRINDKPSLYPAASLAHSVNRAAERPLHGAAIPSQGREPLTIKLLSIRDQNLVSLFIDNRGHLLQLFIP